MVLAKKTLVIPTFCGNRKSYFSLRNTLLKRAYFALVLLCTKRVKMKNAVLILAMLTGYLAIGQEKEFYKNTVLHAQYDHIVVNNYNAPELEPQRETIGFLLGGSTDILATPNFQLDVRLGYRFVSAYAHPNAISFYNQNPEESDDIFYNYHGGRTGLGFNIGQRHVWESAIIVGGGVMKKPGTGLSSSEMEMGFQTGYKYIGTGGLVIRTGLSSNLARNGFFSPMYSGYLGVGYAFQKTEGIYTPGKRKKELPYVNVSLIGYIGSVNTDLIGGKIRVDHFLHNGQYADIGYGVSLQGGLDLYGDRIYSVSPSFIGLFGANENRLEFSIGPNIPFGDISYDYLEGFQFVHLGLGYRLVPDEAPITIKMGTSTTSILHFGVGWRFSRKK